MGQRDANLFGLYLSNVKIYVGNGRDTRFWHDVWIGDTALYLAFPIIFNICTQKQLALVEVVQGVALILMFHWSHEEGFMIGNKMSGIICWS